MNFSTNVTFHPWIGKDYESGGCFKKRILVLGESHYCSPSVREQYCKQCSGCPKTCNGITEYTQDIVHESGYAGGAKRTFTKFFNVFTPPGCAIEDARDSICFYNYVQESLGGPRHSPTEGQFKDSEPAFFEVLNKLAPEFLLVWGFHLWKNMSKTFCYKENFEINGVSCQGGYYQLKNGNKVKFLVLYHPSSPLFSRTILAPVIKEFLDKPS